MQFIEIGVRQSLLLVLTCKKSALLVFTFQPVSELSITVASAWQDLDKLVAEA
uniref:Uncharacterized protein n=1 Tax=Arundo donax TaxID=35708 RepID=A0A0A9DSN2_ARUDO